ncbi:oryzain beta chain-like, partial [Bidens hawaiensis]|uniref:oryzain beta chain-like n=1 Tax=Bidens hawaiensis TaxID=980011 RepID=UPI00404B84A7
MGRREYLFSSWRGCVANSLRKAVSITGYDRVPGNDENTLMWAVAHGPIVAAIEADEEFMRNSTGIHEKHSRESFLNHHVLVIGYGTNDEGNDYWIIQNSNVDTWGKHGCATMPRNLTLESGYCNLAKYAFYPTMNGVVPPFVTPPPQAILYKP